MKGWDQISQEIAIARYMVQLLWQTEVLVVALHKRVFGLGLFLKGDGFPCRARLRPEDFSGHHVYWIWGRGR